MVAFCTFCYLCCTYFILLIHNAEKSGSSLITNSEAIAKNDPSFLKNIGPTLSSMTIASRETTLIAECSDLPDEQIDHFELLKPTMLNLCEALQLEVRI